MSTAASVAHAHRRKLVPLFAVFLGLWPFLRSTQKTTPSPPPVASSTAADSTPAAPAADSQPNKQARLVGAFFDKRVDCSEHPEYVPAEAEEFVAHGNFWPIVDGAATITYSYSNLLDGEMGLPAATLRSAIEEALAEWASKVPITFIEVADSGPPVTPDGSDPAYNEAGTPNLRFGHHKFDGRSGTLAHGYFPPPNGGGLAGDVHFDNEENWSIAPRAGSTDFLEVAVHEIGHALGLRHEPQPPFGNDAIMNPNYAARYSGLGTAFLLPDDCEGIQAVFAGTGGNSSSCPSVASLAHRRDLPDEKVAGILDSIRGFRDNVLARSDDGLEMTQLYYQASPEVNHIMRRHPHIAWRSSSLLLQLYPAVAAADQHDGKVVLDRDTYNRCLSLIGDYKLYASKRLRGQLQKAETFWKSRTKKSLTGEMVVDFSAGD